jgi:hypothetical protein
MRRSRLRLYLIKGLSGVLVQTEQNENRSLYLLSSVEMYIVED